MGTEIVVTYRVGKTQKDRERNYPQRRAENRMSREAWMKSGGKFPKEACNGKRNRQN